LITLLDSNSTIILLYTYIFIYNLAIFLIFSSLFQVIHSELKTLHTLNDVFNGRLRRWLITVALFSMAGVPPFWGFFAKILLFTFYANSYYFLFFSILFILLFLGLYFYVQNIRFLHTTNMTQPTTIVEFNSRVTPILVLVNLINCFFLIFGFIITDDILILMNWLLFN
jgi:NADH-quinone oxidoreductase subunit N